MLCYVSIGIFNVSFGWLWSASSLPLTYGFVVINLDINYRFSYGLVLEVPALLILILLNNSAYHAPVIGGWLNLDSIHIAF